METVKNGAVVIISTIMVLGLTLGARFAMHSELFNVESVEVLSLSDHPPVSASTITRLAAVAVGKISIFDLDLNEIEERLLTNEWIREVKLEKVHERLQKKTLQITVTFREPKAIYQGTKGSLSYIDSDGKIFAPVDLFNWVDVPLISINDSSASVNSTKIKESLKLIDHWKYSKISQIAAISSISWDRDRGYRVLASYSMQGTIQKGISTSFTDRTMIDMGQEIDETLDGTLLRLTNIFQYLGRNSIAAHQVWADAGKKIVVKTTRGS